MTLHLASHLAQIMLAAVVPRITLTTYARLCQTSVLLSVQPLIALPPS